jgi:hypothetical protein
MSDSMGAKSNRPAGPSPAYLHRMTENSFVTNKELIFFYFKQQFLVARPLPTAEPILGIRQ